jgi:hypothetical protein
VTIENKTPTGQPVRPGRRPGLRLGALIGSGDRIGVFVLPFVLFGVALDIAFPEAFGVGVALYVASRLFAPAEEADLADRFGPEWDAYCRRVKVPWL